MADPGCDFEDEDGIRCGKTPTAVRITEMIDNPAPDLGMGHVAGAVEIAKHYCRDHLPTAGHFIFDLEP